jgi:hypothetical protein
MYSLSELGKAIADIQQKNLSGVMMVSGQRLRSDTATVTYSLRFESGDLARIGGAGKAVGVDAVLELVAMQALTQTRWFPLNPTANWSGRAQIPRDDLMGFLDLAVTPPALTAKPATAATDPSHSQDAETVGKALLAHVHAVFLNVYLGDTNADLKQVAKLHPPATDPSAFIEACVHLLEPMVGAVGARALLGKT